MKVAISVLLASIGVVLVYLLHAFVQVDMNFANWTEQVRSGCAFLMVCAGVIGGAVGAIF